MIRVLAPRVDSERGAFAGAALAAAAFVVWASRTIATKGSHGLMEVAAVVVAPLALWLVWTRPLLFPYGLYAIIVPLDIFTQLGTAESTVARLVGLAAAAALLLYAIRMHSLRVPSLSIIWLLLFVGWEALTALWSIDLENAGRESMTMVMIAGLYLAIACYPTQRRDITPVLIAIVLGGLVASAVGIYEFRSEGFQQTAFLQSYNRISITFNQISLDPNLYSDGLLLPFAIALTWFARTKRFLSGAGALVTMGVLLVALGLAASREAMIALALEIIVLVTLLRAWKRLAVPLIVLIGGGLTFFPNVIQRALADAGNGGSGRTSIWSVGWAAFLQHPLVGTGAGSFATIYDRWYLRIFQSYDDGWHRASHNLIVHYGVELGLVGLVLLAGWCFSQWALARRLPRVGQLGDVRAICLASLAALGLVSFFVDLFDAKFVWLAFALVAQVRNAATTSESSG